MAVLERRADLGRGEAQRVARAVGQEIRAARRAAGLSQRAAASAVGLDASTVSRIERGAFEGISVRGLSLCCAAVGLRLSVRTFPHGDPVRDAGQLRLLGRFRARLPAGSPWATEVPLPILGDRRALDARTVLGQRAVMIEAEVRLDDVQALARRLALKVRDAGAQLVIVVVADTRHNRAVLTAHRESLRALLPLDTRAVLAAVSAGLPPARSGIVVL